MPVRKLLVVISCLCVAPSAFGQAPVAAPAPIGSSTAMGLPGGTYPGPEYLPDAPGYFAEPVPADLPPIPESWLRSLWDPQPWIEVRAEALWLMPDFPDSVPLGSQVRPRDELNYEVRDIRLTASSQYVASMRTVAELHFGPNLSVEAAGFTMDGPTQSNQPVSLQDLVVFLDAEATNPNISEDVRQSLRPGFAIDDQGNVLRRGFLQNLPDGFPTEAEEMNVNWDFRSSGADFAVLYHWVPLRGNVSDLAFGIGGRYFNTEETVGVFFLDDIVTPPRTGLLRSAVDNNMAGPQFMARVRVQGPGRRIRSVADVKIGMMASDTRVTNSIYTGAGLIAQDTYSRTIFGSLFESNFYIEYFLTENFSVYGGFQLFYVDRIARGSEQLTQDLDLFTDKHKDLGSLFMFGPRAGIVISF